MLETVRQRNGAGVNQRDLNEDLMTIRTGLVTLHGEVVLMESYSTLNYTGWPLGSYFLSYSVIGLSRSEIFFVKGKSPVFFRVRVEQLSAFLL